LPVVRPYYDGYNAGAGGATFKLGVRVFEGVACSVQTSITPAGPWQPQGDISKENSPVVVKQKMPNARLPVTLRLFVRYETVLGDAIEDCFEFIHRDSDQGTISEKRIVSRHLIGEATYLSRLEEPSTEEPA
jgi:hypothetical protein